MIINDAHYLIDEVLSKLPEIRQIELEMANTSQWLAQDQVTIAI